MFTLFSMSRAAIIFQDPGSYDLRRNVHGICLYNTISAVHQHPGNRRKRLYLHVDMNCFYAQVEQQCYNLYGVPIIIGGWRKDNGIPRGIVATASYEARAFGIKIGMSHFEAVRLCPYLVPLQVHYEKYQAISREFSKVLNHFSPDVEAYSMDEHFIDVSFLLSRSRREIEEFGNRLKNEIYRKINLICSIGVSYSKTYAKLASDLEKPNGLTLVLDVETAREKIYPLPLIEVWGIGSRRFAKLQDEGLHTISDAVEHGPGPFLKLFGAYFGRMLWETATGKDCAKIMDAAGHVPNDVSYMHTFSDWTDEIERVKGEIAKAVRQVCYRMRGYDRRAENYGCYIRFQDVTWKGVSFDFSTPGLTNLDTYVIAACLEKANPLLNRFLKEGHKIRGIGVHTIDSNANRQMELFFREDERLAGMYCAIDKINNCFGLDTIMPASIKYSVKGKTHFLERND